MYTYLPQLMLAIVKQICNSKLLDPSNLADLHKVVDDAVGCWTEIS